MGLSCQEIGSNKERKKELKKRRYTYAVVSNSTVYIASLLNIKGSTR
jgi:hypothetical protein